MKKISFTNLLIVVMVVSMAGLMGCKKDVSGCTDPAGINYNPDANVENGTCQYIGEVTFWQSGSPSYGITTVYVNGVSSSITSDYSSGTPDCGTSGCANFTLEPGTYNYTAEESGLLGATWSGTVTVTSNGCLTVKLL